jgi:hypothetical protein
VAVLLLVGSCPSASAGLEPQWATDLRHKAEGWKQSLLDAVQRLKGAAQAAGDQLRADVRKRLDELIAMLEAHADALAEVLRTRGDEFYAIAAARARQAAALAQQAERELGEILAGTRAQLSIDLSRLGSGTRQVLSDALAEAGATLGAARLVDDRVVARAVEHNASAMKRGGWALAAAGGGALAVIALGLLWPRRRAGDAATSGVRRWRAAPAQAGEVVVAVRRCDALDHSAAAIASHDRAALDAVVHQLARCQLAAADDATAALVTDHLRRALAARPQGGPP